jgi:hypothetical protein
MVMIDHERFKDVTAGVQSIVLTLGVIIGGIWTIYTFSALGNVEKAKAELFKQAVIDTEIEAKQESLGPEPGFYISINIKLTNRGNRNTYFDFTRTTLKVFRVGFEESGGKGSEAGTQIEEFLQVLPGSEGMVLRTGGTVSRPLFVKVPMAGLYLITFEVPVSDTDMQVYKESGGKENEGKADKPVWAAFNYVLVK